MNKIFQSIINRLKYIQRFGLIQGLYLIARILIHKRGQQQFALHVSNIKYPLSLRPKTSDLAVFEELVVGDEYGFPLHFTPQVIIDAGANIGIASALFANKYPEAKIIALEPEHSNYQMLLANTSQYTNIIPLECALWSHTGKLQIKNPTDSKWKVQVTELESDAENGLPCVHLDDLIQQQSLTTIDILKIDIEGAEKEIFEARSHRWLQMTKVLIVEVHDTLVPGCSHALENVIQTRKHRREQHGEKIVIFFDQ